jgi:CRISPR/Cas system CSM-associated protein Csm2 small subunit
MTKEEKVEKVVEQPKDVPKQVEIKDVPTGKLKEIAFDVDQQIKALQRQYNQLYTEISLRLQEEANGPKKE